MARARISGVYAITNCLNGKQYIGSSINIHGRWTEHRSDLRRGISQCRKLQCAWAKYGEDAFAFSILETQDVENRNTLRDREEWYIQTFHPAYNIQPHANPNAGRPHTPESRAKISATKRARGYHISDAQKDLLRRIHTGKALSPERYAQRLVTMRREDVRQKIGEKSRGRKDSEETIQRKREASLIAQNRPDVKEKNRQAQLGKKMSPDAIERYIISRYGDKWTQERLQQWLDAFRRKQQCIFAQPNLWSDDALSA